MSKTNQADIYENIHTVDALIRLDGNGAVINCDKAFLSLFGTDSEGAKNFYAFMPEFQPDGKSSQAFFKNQVKFAIEDELGSKGPEFSWLFARTDKKYFLADVLLTKCMGSSDDFIACSIKTSFVDIDISAINEERKMNEQRLHAILDNVPASLNFWDADGNLLYCNKYTVEMLELEGTKNITEEFISRYPEKQPDGRSSVEASNEAIKAALQSGSFSTPWTLLDAKGNEIPAVCNLYRISWGDGIAVFEYLSDLREHHKFVKEQRDNQARLLAIISNLPAGIFICDEGFNILSRNNFMDGILGLKEDEAISDFFEFLPKTQSDGTNSRKTAKAILSKAFTKGGSRNFPFEAVSRDGEILPLDCTISRIPWGDGFACMVFCHDLREQKSYEERLRLIVDNMPLACNFRDENFALVDSNQAARELFGVSTTEEYAKRVIEFSPPLQPCGTPSREKGEQYIALAHEKGTITFDWLSQKVDGTPIPTEITLIPVHWRGRTMICTFIRDMREIIKNQNEQKTARERMLAMINASPLMCYVCDTDFNVIDCNDISPKLMDLDSKQDFLDNFRSLHPRMQPCGRTSIEAADDYLGRALKQGSNTFKWWFRKPDKELLPVESSVSRVDLGDQQLLIVYSRDLRESIKFDEERRVARERIEAMLDASPLACSILDDKFNILICNQSVVELFELKDKDDYISNFLQLHPELQPDGRNSFEKLKENTERAFVDGSGVMTFEWMFQTLSGDLVPSEMTLKPVTLDDKNLMIAYIQDLRHIKQAAQAAEALEKLAYTDSLTGASNRRYFVDVAERELKNSIDGGLPFTLILLDIDNFKVVNDTYGHVVGDGVLRILVSRIRHTLRKNVVVARYGGEEFIIMMPGIPEEAAERTAWRIRKNIDGSKFLVEGVRVPVTVSMGVAGRDLDKKDSLTDIIVKADKALYAAKAGGKNTVVQYNESMEHTFLDAAAPAPSKPDKQVKEKPKGRKKQSHDR